MAISEDTDMTELERLLGEYLTPDVISQLNQDHINQLTAEGIFNWDAPEINVFVMDDYTWWAGEDAESCIQSYMEWTGMIREDLFPDEDYQPYELSPKAMLSYQIHYDEHDYSKHISYRAYLTKMILDDEKFPVFFAGREC